MMPIGGPLSAYLRYVSGSGRFILAQRGAARRALAAVVVLLPWLAILALCVLLLVRAGTQ